MMSVSVNGVGNDVGYRANDVGGGSNDVGMAAKMVSHCATPFLTSSIQKTLILSCQ